MKKILIILAILIFISGCKNKEEVDIKTYDTKMVCKYTYQDELEDDYYESKSIIYVDYDENELVTKAIYQSITDLSTYNDYLLESLDDIINIYNGMSGIKANRYMSGNMLVFEIAYDYKKIDLKEFKNKLGNLIDDASLLATVDELPVDLGKYKSLELKDYECEEK